VGIDSVADRIEVDMNMPVGISHRPLQVGLCRALRNS
jgi:hypothetical protein